MAAIGYVLVWALIWGLIGSLAGKPKNQQVSGIVWCLLLGPIGLLITVLLPDLSPKPEPVDEDFALRERIEREERIRAEVRARIESGDTTRPEIGNPPPKVPPDARTAKLLSRMPPPKM